jgi:hypothetical protein
MRVFGQLVAWVAWALFTTPQWPLGKPEQDAALATKGLSLQFDLVAQCCECRRSKIRTGRKISGQRFLYGQRAASNELPNRGSNVLLNVT